MQAIIWRLILFNKMKKNITFLLLFYSFFGFSQTTQQLEKINTFINNNKCDEAEKVLLEFDYVNSTNKELPLILKNLAGCISESDNKKAFEIAQKALELNQKQENNQPNELQARILQNIGVNFLNQNKAEEAEKYILRSINITENLTKFNNKILLIFYKSLAYCQIDLKKDGDLYNTYKKIRQICIDNKETESEGYFVTVGNITEHFLIQKKLNEAQNILEELLPKYSASMDSLNYCRLMEQLLYIHSRNDFLPTQKTIDLLKSVNFKRIENSVNKDDIASSLVFINSKLYYSFSVYSNIITKDVLDQITINNFILLPKIESVSTKKDELFYFLKNVRHIFEFHDKEKLTDFEKQIIFNLLVSKNTKLNFESYTWCMEIIAKRCIVLGEFDLAEKCYKKLIELFLNDDEINQNELPLFFRYFAEMNRKMGKFKENIDFFENISRTFKLNEYNENEVNRILSEYYLEIRNVEKFEKYLMKVIKFDEFRINNNYTVSPLAALNDLGLSTLYSFQNRNIEARNLTLLAIKNFERNTKYIKDSILKKQIKYIIFLQVESISNRFIDSDFSKELRNTLEQEFKDCQECKFANDSFSSTDDELKLLSNLDELKNKKDLISKYKIIYAYEAIYYYYTSPQNSYKFSQNIEKVLNYLIEGKNFTGNYPLERIRFNQNIISILRQQQKEGIYPLLLENETLIKQLYGPNSSNLYNFYIELGMYHFDNKNYLLATTILEKAYNFFKGSKLKCDIPFYYFVCVLSSSYWLQENFIKSNEYFKICLQERILYYKSISGHLNEEQFEKLNELYQIGKISNIIKSSPLRRNLINGSNEADYDFELLIKQFFLTNELYLKRLPSKINDELLEINKELSKQILTKEQKEEIIFKKTLLDAELSNLSYDSDTIQNQSSNITWEVIQKRLKKKEVAIEFVSIESENINNNVALLLQPNNQKAIYIYLCTQQQIDSLWQVSKQGEVNNAINQFYNNPKLYELIWKPLEKHLVGVSKIYFAPAGGLHKIAFQALTGSDGEKLSKKYDMIQLTSTRELMDKELYTINSTANFALFGGINYDADSTQLSQNKANFTNNDISYTINTRDSKKEKFSKLQFTDNEVKGIASLFNRKVNQLFTGNAATEEQFKLLGSYTKPSPTIIHLATHGFYFDETNVDKHSLEKQTFEEIGKKSNGFKKSSNPLLRSGLVMAGANHAWQGKPAFKGLEDGILTAQEIANLNLSNTKLVVLSACESGLGDIKNNNEGVYGLQRAFKMAGVEYLLVSLWSVDDFTTQKMMRLFYTNLKTGLSIEESYKSMVENIKKQYPDEPFKWASFVLIK